MLKRRKMLFIYNPKAGRGLIKNSLAAIIELFSGNGFDVIVYPTKWKLDGAKVAKDRAAEFDLVVCCGGDGTLDEVISGLMVREYGAAVGYIPAGNTNDFANSLGIPRQMEKAAQAILGGSARKCDLGMLNNNYFVYVAAFGFMADISYQTDQELKNNLGYVVYLLEMVKSLRNWKSYHLRIQSDQFSDEGNFILGMITNSNSVGGIKGIVGKNTELDDGLFEVMLIKTPVNVIEWQEVVAGIIARESNNKVVIFKTDKIIIDAEEQVVWTLDGEAAGVWDYIEIKNLNKAFSIIC